MPKSNQNPFSLAPLFSCSWVNKPSSSSSLSSLSIMAPHQKTTQHKKPKPNFFLTCFGFSSKNSTMNNTTIKKPKTKKSGSGRKKSFKFCWPKLKVIVIKKKDIILDPKTAALKASHDIMLQATKIHQLKFIDHHQVKNSHEPNVTSKGSKHPRDNKSQSHCATCHDNINPSTPKIINSSILTDKVSKDSLIGVSLMVMMLIIMSIWGRLCAILCFSALLYCIPFIRPANRVVRPHHTENKLGSIDNLKLEWDKRKVVLQGLLQRDHKDNANGIS